MNRTAIITAFVIGVLTGGFVGYAIKPNPPVLTPKDAEMISKKMVTGSLPALMTATSRSSQAMQICEMLESKEKILKLCADAFEHYYATAAQVIENGDLYFIQGEIDKHKAKIREFIEKHPDMPFSPSEVQVNEPPLTSR